MDTLAAKVLKDPAHRARVIDDCVVLVDEEVAKKGGLTGLAIKGAYGIVKAIKKGIIKESVDHLLDGFISQLEPFYARRGNEAFSAVVLREPAQVADALLSFTDEKARVATNNTMKKAYEKLRPTAKDHVQQAVPALGRLIDKHVQ